MFRGLFNNSLRNWLSEFKPKKMWIDFEEDHGYKYSIKVYGDFFKPEAI